MAGVPRQTTGGRRVLLQKWHVGAIIFSTPGPQCPLRAPVNQQIQHERQKRGGHGKRNIPNAPVCKHLPFSHVKPLANSNPYSKPTRSTSRTTSSRARRFATTHRCGGRPPLSYQTGGAPALGPFSLTPSPPRCTSCVSRHPVPGQSWSIGFPRARRHTENDTGKYTPLVVPSKPRHALAKRGYWVQSAQLRIHSPQSRPYWLEPDPPPFSLEPDPPPSPSNLTPPLLPFSHMPLNACTHQAAVSTQNRGRSSAESSLSIPVSPWDALGASREEGTLR